MSLKKYFNELFEIFGLQFFPIGFEMLQGHFEKTKKVNSKINQIFTKFQNNQFCEN